MASELQRTSGDSELPETGAAPNSSGGVTPPSVVVFRTAEDAAMAPMSVPTALNSEENDATAPEEANSARYSTDLLQSFAEVCQKAKSGVQTCHVVAAFVQERANMETAYSKALLKVAQ